MYVYVCAVVIVFALGRMNEPLSCHFVLLGLLNPPLPVTVVNFGAVKLSHVDVLKCLQGGVLVKDSATACLHLVRLMENDRAGTHTDFPSSKTYTPT